MKEFWPKILPLGNCRRYLRRYGHNRPGLYFSCSNKGCCGKAMHRHGCYFRMAVFKRKYYQIPIYRWCCPNCGHTISALPNFLTPWGHFALPVREAALKRKADGQSWQKIMKNIVLDGISRRTIKRWWKCHLYKAAGTARWLCAELIHAGENEDLLRLHSCGINPTSQDTVHWLTTLVRKYLSLLALNPKPLMGYFGILNTILPASKLI